MMHFLHFCMDLNVNSKHGHFFGPIFSMLELCDSFIHPVPIHVLQ
jgi:hypothetical protein